MESLHYLLMRAHTRMHRRIRARAAELVLDMAKKDGLPAVVVMPSGSAAYSAVPFSAERETAAA